ncbi:MAG TPA: pyridoxal-phosphate dependent enzyme [Bryobacteraceae bacterium]|nr:pyridoxal-phosphate dependent enzyme [Bryobacteraceae bacterium]
MTRISLEQIEKASRTIDPVFLNSPQFESETMGAELGMRLVLKVETVNPIRCFKGRGADFFVAGLPDDSPRLVCASAGNMGQGMAYAARQRGCALTVFAAETANPLKVERMRQLGAEVKIAGGDFDAAKEHARAFAEEQGAQFVEDGRETPLAEGAGSIAVELCRWREPFDFLLVPLGDGALLAGIGHWMKTHSPSTRLIAICAAGAAAMNLTLRSGMVQTIESAATIADGIAVRVPVPESLEHLAGIPDDILLVEDEAMVQAMRLVFRHHGLVVEPSGVAGLAAAMVFRDRFRGAVVGTPLTGGNVTAEQMEQWLLGKTFQPVE